MGRNTKKQLSFDDDLLPEGDADVVNAMDDEGDCDIRTPVITGDDMEEATDIEVRESGHMQQPSSSDIED